MQKAAHLCQIATKCQTFLKQPQDHKESHAESKPFKQVNQSNKMQCLKLFNQSISDFHSNTISQQPTIRAQRILARAFLLPALISVTVHTSLWNLICWLIWQHFEAFFPYFYQFLRSEFSSLLHLPSVLLTHHLPLPIRPVFNTQTLFSLTPLCLTHPFCALQINFHSSRHPPPICHNPSETSLHPISTTMTFSATFPLFLLPLLPHWLHGAFFPKLWASNNF